MQRTGTTANDIAVSGRLGIFLDERAGIRQVTRSFLGVGQIEDERFGRQQGLKQGGLSRLARPEDKMHVGRQPWLENGSCDESMIRTC